MMKLTPLFCICLIGMAAIAGGKSEHSTSANEHVRIKDMRDNAVPWPKWVTRENNNWVDSGVTGATTPSTQGVKATEQSQTEKDVAIAAQIRQDLMKDKNLSMRAHNLMVVSENGIVTLRGFVPNANEKFSVEKIARSVSGVTSVNNLVQVKE